MSSVSKGTTLNLLRIRIVINTNGPSPKSSCPSPESALAVERARLQPSSTYDHDLSLRSSNRGRSSPPLQSTLLQITPSYDRRTASRGHGRRTLRSRPNPRHNSH